jgi:hypothetical protein
MERAGVACKIATTHADVSAGNKNHTHPAWTVTVAATIRTAGHGGILLRRLSASAIPMETRDISGAKRERFRITTITSSIRQAPVRRSVIE